MKHFLSNLPALSVLMVLMLGGCTKDSADLTKDQLLSETSKAPLLRSASVTSDLKDSYIVVFKDDDDNVDAEVDAEVEHQGQRFGVKADHIYKHALKGFAGKITGAALDELRNNPRVKYIEQDQEAHIVGSQSNPPSWGLDRSDQRALPLDASYNYNQAGLNVDAYIFDTGIRLTHNDFGGRAIAGYDAITLGGTAKDGNGHGTHVAGTVGGSTYGIAKNVHLIAVRVLNNQGSGTYSQVIAGLDWAVANHTTIPAVGNMSLGGPISSALDDAIRRVVKDGIVLCVAAGNSAADASTSSPSRVAEAITVGATDVNDAFASFSNYGSVVDILAPGVSITSDYFISNTSTATMSGTSMATPHVTGAAALYLEANPTATPALVESGLKTIATQNPITKVPSGTTNLLLYTIVGPLPPAPPAPLLSSPTDAATGVAIPTVLSWNASFGPASYTVQVSLNSRFSSILYAVSGIAGTSTTVTGLSGNTQYYWRVNAINAGGVSESATWSFTTGVLVVIPLAPILNSPLNNATNVSVPVNLTWAASTGAVSYVIQVSKNSNFSSLVQNISQSVTAVTVSGLSKSTKYYRRVSAINSAGTSPWSGTRNFTTARR